MKTARDLSSPRRARPAADAGRSLARVTEKRLRERCVPDRQARAARNVLSIARHTPPFSFTGRPDAAVPATAA